MTTTENNYDVKNTFGQQNIAKSVNSQFQKLIDEQHFEVPADYNVMNALQAAVLKIGGDKNLSSANPDSIKKALFDMIVQGLSVSKDQLYFIKYGDNLQMQRSYFGTQTALKRLKSIKDLIAYVVHEDDEFEIGFNDETGLLEVTKHNTSLPNLDKPIIAAYAMIIKSDGTKQYEVMTKKQIDNSWSQTKSNGAVQKKFPEEMAKRTVINRAAKNIINTDSGDDQLTDAINNTTKNEFNDDPVDVTNSVNNKAAELITKSSNKVATGASDDDKAENRKALQHVKKTEEVSLLDDDSSASQPKDVTDVEESATVDENGFAEASADF